MSSIPAFFVCVYSGNTYRNAGDIGMAVDGLWFVNGTQYPKRPVQHFTGDSISGFVWRDSTGKIVHIWGRFYPMEVSLTSVLVTVEIRYEHWSETNFSWSESDRRLESLSRMVQRYRVSCPLLK